jgi:long-chain acyl-CoA synthetase
VTAAAVGLLALFARELAELGISIMHIDFLLKIFEKNSESDAIVWKDNVYSYGWLLDRIEYWRRIIASQEVDSGSVVILEADFSPNSVALFLSLMEHSCILVPITESVGQNRSKFIEIAQGEVSFLIDENDSVQITGLSNIANHPLYSKIKDSGHPGLVLFSSGSTGESKAVVHDLVGILEKFKVPRHSYRTISFLLYDHIGGLNTTLYTLSNAGCLVTLDDRSPDAVLNAVAKYKVNLLPTTPTFINLILISEAYEHYNLDSLQIITYGTEPMLESSLRRFAELFPKVKLLQTYGLSEVGILRSKSKSSDSLWMKVGGEGFSTRVVDGVLQIKAKSAMLGYLNAPSPFTEDGWLDTKDSVEVDGEYIRVLGRKTEIINVGGEKVYPAEVESVICALENVNEAEVYGEENAIMGNIVCARISLIKPEDHKDFIDEVKSHCATKLEKYKVPVKVEIVGHKLHSARFKKTRTNSALRQSEPS